jgi:hypothetical protein
MSCSSRLRAAVLLLLILLFTPRASHAQASNDGCGACSASRAMDESSPVVTTPPTSRFRTPALGLWQRWLDQQTRIRADLRLSAPRRFGPTLGRTGRGAR